MASYHCTVKVGAKGKAGHHAAYISREGKYSRSDRYEDLESKGTGNMPAWADQRTAHFWNAADEHERANGATYREIEVALPRELTPVQRQALVQAFITQELGDRHAYQWAIHTPKGAIDNGQQPHAHIMYSERTLDGLARDPAQYFKRYNAKNPENGGCRKDSAGTEERLQATRAAWAQLQNAHLERHGHTDRVDHRSLKAQGIDRVPEKHLGGSGVRKLNGQDITGLLARRAAEGELERAQQRVSLIDLSGDLGAARAERDRQQAAARPTLDPVKLEAGLSGVRQKLAERALARQQELTWQVEQSRQAEQAKREERAKSAELAAKQAQAKATQEPKEPNAPERKQNNDPGLSR